MTEKVYKGMIVEESLEDNRLINDFKVTNVLITKDNNSSKRWHIYTVQITKKQLENLSKVIKPRRFYAHFWDDDKNIVAVFRNRVFEFSYNDKQSWQPAIEHGLSVDIPKGELDFLIKE